MTIQSDVQNDEVEGLGDLLKRELQAVQSSRREVDLRLEQSRSELNKLTQRNAQIAAQLQKVQTQVDAIPKTEIVAAFKSALDVQQRLLVMRGQIEKLQGDHQNHEKLSALIQSAQEAMRTSARKEEVVSDQKSPSAVLEMIMDAQETERKKLSRQMHDGPAQALSNFVVQTDIVTRMFDGDPETARKELENLKNSAMNTYQQVRDFVFDLRPMMLDDLGLFPTMRKYVDSFKEQTNTELDFAIYGQERRLEPYLEAMIFRAVQELLHNAWFHNQGLPSKLQIEVRVTLDDNGVRVMVNDNGKGFRPEILKDTSGLGLKLTRERVEVTGGTMEIDSQEGHGTNINFYVPFTEKK
jgi:two-component system sensor histidine kinase DegS